MLAGNLMQLQHHVIILRYLLTPYWFFWCHNGFIWLMIIGKCCRGGSAYIRVAQPWNEHSGTAVEMYYFSHFKCFVTLLPLLHNMWAYSLLLSHKFAPNYTALELTSTCSSKSHPKYNIVNCILYFPPGFWHCTGSMVTFQWTVGWGGGLYS